MNTIVDFDGLQESYCDESTTFYEWYAHEAGIPFAEMQYSDKCEAEYYAWESALGEKCRKDAGDGLFLAPMERGRLTAGDSLRRITDNDKRKLFSIPDKELGEYAAILVAETLGYTDEDEHGKPCRIVDYDGNMNPILAYPPENPLDLCEIRETPAGYRYLAFGNRYIGRGDKTAPFPRMDKCREDRKRTDDWLEIDINGDMTDSLFWQRHQDWLEEI